MFPSYRSTTPKARLIPLNQPFLTYLRSDGIILPDEETLDLIDSGTFSTIDDSLEPYPDEDDPDDPSLAWPTIHNAIKSTITELGGCVMPKLNWSAPKDATWIAATNSMECRTPNDIYLLLKSSDFVTHDLDQAFDGCTRETISEHDEPANSHIEEIGEIPYHLVLRKTIPTFITSLEFRCFVRDQRLLAICQRDLNHYEFLQKMVPFLHDMIDCFFEKRLKRTFPDENFVFDVYIPQPKEGGRVWLIDINPWAPRTDPLLFSWMEILGMRFAEQKSALIDMANAATNLSIQDHDKATEASQTEDHDSSISDKDEVMHLRSQFRIVSRDDPEAYTFNTPQYSAHKLPKEVVDAGVDGVGGLQEFMGQWRDIVAKQERENDQENV